MTKQEWSNLEQSYQTEIGQFVYNILQDWGLRYQYKVENCMLSTSLHSRTTWTASLEKKGSMQISLNFRDGCSYNCLKVKVGVKFKIINRNSGEKMRFSLLMNYSYYANYSIFSANHIVHIPPCTLCVAFIAYTFHLWRDFSRCVCDYSNILFQD